MGRDTRWLDRQLVKEDKEIWNHTSSFPLSEDDGFPRLSINDASADEGAALVFIVTQQVESLVDSEAIWTVRLPKTATTIGELSLDDLDADNFIGIRVNYDGDFAILTGVVNIPAGQKKHTNYHSDQG